MSNHVCLSFTDEQTQNSVKHSPCSFFMLRDLPNNTPQDVIFLFLWNLIGITLFLLIEASQTSPASRSLCVLLPDRITDSQGPTEQPSLPHNVGDSFAATPIFCLFRSAKHRWCSSFSPTSHPPRTPPPPSQVVAAIAPLFSYCRQRERNPRGLIGDRMLPFCSLTLAYPFRGRRSDGLVTAWAALLLHSSPSSNQSSTGGICLFVYNRFRVSFLWICQGIETQAYQAPVAFVCFLLFISTTIS